MAEPPQRADLDELLRWYGASGDAQPSLLRWCRTVGYARHGGVSVDMHEPCAVAGADAVCVWVEADWAPGLTLDGEPLPIVGAESEVMLF